MIASVPGDDRRARVLVRVEGLRKHYRVRRGVGRRATLVRAVDDVSIEILAGETLGLVGESGSGKTTLGRAILRLVEPTAGRVELAVSETETVDLAALRGRDLRAVRRHAQMIFQDPYTSLDPRLTVREIVTEPLRVHRLARDGDLERRAHDLMHRVGLDAAHLGQRPDALSGGQRQRVGIARAIATRPRFIVADEPVAALDVSVQGQILNQLRDLQEELSLTMLFISHDLAVVDHMADRVAVMYLGQIVERAPTASLFARPRHPYTELLIAHSVARRETGTGAAAVPAGAPGELGDELPDGCRFHPRCPYAASRCEREVPGLEEVAGGHLVACHLAGELVLQGATGSGLIIRPSSPPPMPRTHVPRAVRFALAMPGRYRLPRRSRWRDVRIVNLSDTGILFRAPEPLSLGTLFEMIVDTPMQIGNLAPGQFRCLARVTRSEPVSTTENGYPVGAEFVEFLVD